MKTKEEKGPNLMFSLTQNGVSWFVSLGGGCCGVLLLGCAAFVLGEAEVNGLLVVPGHILVDHQPVFVRVGLAGTGRSRVGSPVAP